MQTTKDADTKQLERETSFSSFKAFTESDTMCFTTQFTRNTYYNTIGKER